MTETTTKIRTISQHALSNVNDTIDTLEKTRIILKEIKYHHNYLRDGLAEIREHITNQNYGKALTLTNNMIMTIDSINGVKNNDQKTQ